MLRKEWFAWCAKTRKSIERKTKKKLSHQDSMKEAAKTWPAQKEKIKRKLKRQEKKEKRELTEEK